MLPTVLGIKLELLGRSPRPSLCPESSPSCKNLAPPRAPPPPQAGRASCRSGPACTPVHSTFHAKAQLPRGPLSSSLPLPTKHGWGSVPLRCPSVSCMFPLALQLAKAPDQGSQAPISPPGPSWKLRVSPDGRTERQRFPGLVSKPWGASRGRGPSHAVVLLPSENSLSLPGLSLPISKPSLWPPGSWPRAHPRCLPHGRLPGKEPSWGFIPLHCDLASPHPTWDPQAPRSRAPFRGPPFPRLMNYQLVVTTGLCFPHERG